MVHPYMRANPGEFSCKNVVCGPNARCSCTKNGCYCLTKTIKRRGKGATVVGGMSLRMNPQVQASVQVPNGWTVKSGRLVPPIFPPADVPGMAWVWSLSQGGSYSWKSSALDQVMASQPAVAQAWQQAACTAAPSGRRVLAFVSAYGKAVLRVYCIYPSDRPAPTPLAPPRTISNPTCPPGQPCRRVGVRVRR